MQVLRRTGAALAGSFLFAPAALAHSGHPQEMGMAHVMTSPEHIATFVVVGAAAAALMLGRRTSTVIAANLALFLFVLVQGASHWMSGDALFGIETAVAGAALALGSCRVVQMFFQRTSSQASK